MGSVWDPGNSAATATALTSLFGFSSVLLRVSFPWYAVPDLQSLPDRSTIPPLFFKHSGYVGSGCPPGVSTADMYRTH